MQEINKRFGELRKTLKLNQEEFGKILGISKSGISDIESGRRSVTDKHIIMLVNFKNYNISERWLRFGDGNMFTEPTCNEAITKWAASITKSDDNTFPKKFVTMLTKLSAEEWQFLEKIVLALNQN